MWAPKKHNKRLKIIAALFLVVAFFLLVGNGFIAKMLWANGFKSAAYYVNFSNHQVALNEATYYFGGGTYDVKKAKEAYKLALRLDPATPLAHYQLARIYFVEGDYATALQEINTELITNPQNLRALYVRGLIEMTQADLQNAENDFRRFIAWAPTEWGGYNDLAYVQAKAGKYAKSEQTIQEAMLRVPHAEDVPWLWNSLGLAQLNQFKYREAAASLKNALELANKLTVEEWRRAYTANDPKGDTESVEAFRKAIENNLKAAEAGE